MSSYEPISGACPVCSAPVGTDDDTCPDCSWTLVTPWRLSGDPDAEARRFTVELLRRQRTFDAVAAARVSPDDGRDLGFIRGGRPDDAEWDQALRAAATRTDAPELLRDRLATLITGLPDGARLIVVEVGAAGITATLVGTDAFGILRSRREQTVTWEALAPMLSAESEQKLTFRLAGGFGDVDQALLWQALENTLPGLVMPTGGQVVLVCTAAGWPVPERALELLLQRQPGATRFHVTAINVTELVIQLIAKVPLRQKLELVVAAVHPRTREVMLRGELLFPVGARLGEETSLIVKCVHPDPDGTVFAVVTWQNGGPRVLSIDSVKLSPGSHSMRAVLAGLGRVRFVEPSGMAPDDRVWSELIQALPQRLAASVRDLDLICVIDLSGDQFETRRHLVRELIGVLHQECPEPGRLRVAVIGYGDHIFRPGHEEKQVVRGSWLKPTSDALVSLGRLHAVEAGPLPVAPVEDALHRIARHLGAIPAGRKVVLLTIGDRPPHPSQVGDHGILPCPHLYDWDDSLRRIERRPGVSRIAVLDSVKGHGNAWRRLGKAAIHELRLIDPRQLAMDIGVIVPPSQRLPFPLIEPPGSR